MVPRALHQTGSRLRPPPKRGYTKYTRSDDMAGAARRRCQKQLASGAYRSGRGRKSRAAPGFRALLFEPAASHILNDTSRFRVAFGCGFFLTGIGTTMRFT